jgi:hypothetical protein
MLSAGRNLQQVLAVDQCDAGELIALLTFFFNMSRQRDPDAVDFLRDGECAVTVHLSRHNDIVAVDRGPGLSDDELTRLQAQIREELIAPSSAVVGRDVLFAGYPVRGFLQIGAELAILPVPDCAPRPNFLLAEHPFLIEFRLPSSKNYWIQNARRQHASFQMALFLNLVFSRGVTWYGPRSRNAWAWVDPASGSRDAYQFCQLNYCYSGFVRESDQFTDTQPFAKLKEVPADRYFDDPDALSDYELTVPSSLHEQYRSWKALSRAEERVFFRALYWYYCGGELFDTSVTAGFLAISRAIEALLPAQSDEARCPSCHRAVGPSISRRFRNFLDEFSPPLGTEDATVRQQLYATRSKYAHGSGLMLLDEFPLNTGLTHRSSEDRTVLNCAFKLTRRAVLNWLLKTKA